MSSTMSAAVLDRDPVNTPAAVLSVAVHIALFAFLFFGIRWQSKLPDAVFVELWDRPAVLEKPAETPQPQAEPKPEPMVEPEPKVEAKPPKPDIAVEKEKKAPPKKEPKKVEPKVEPTVKKFDRAPDFQKEAARELAQVSRPSRHSQPLPAGPVIDPSYANKIKTKIKANVVLPADIKGDPEAIFDVVQLPTGEVLSARLRKSSGNRAYDEAVERAILKSSPLPRPDRPDQFARELQLKFRPVE